jgi:hypothetical protein
MIQRLMLAASIAIATSGCAGSRHAGMMHESPHASAYGAEVEAGYARVRAATSRFHAVDSAIVAGYNPSVAQCVSDSVHGAMGYHHLNRALVDDRIELERPEFLIYERRPDGSYAMNAVEYIVPYRVWPRDSVPPKLLGRDFLRYDALNLWGLHMWIWTKNPAGLFAEWNPNVTCPPARPARRDQ